MNENDQPIDVDIVVLEEDNSIFIKLSGLCSREKADACADHLAKYLPLMLFESTVLH